MTKSEILAQSAIVEARSALRNATSNKLETGPAFEGSSNCLANIERDYDRRNGGSWFKPAEMRFFGTKFEGGFGDVPSARVTIFITTDKPRGGVRKASIRLYLWDTASISTVGAFCEYSLPVVRAAVDALTDALKQPDPIAQLYAA